MKLWNHSQKLKLPRIGGDTKWRSEAACLAFNTAVWWSSTSVKQVGVIHPLHFSSVQASPLLSSITSDGTEEPRSLQSRAATELNSWSQPTGVQACRRSGCAALWFAHCFDLPSGSGEGTVEYFTRLDDFLLGTLYHTEWKDRMMYYAGETNFLVECH